MNEKPVTPKERVLRIHPDAECWRARDTGNWLVTLKAHGHRRIGVGPTAQLAWRNAAIDKRSKFEKMSPTNKKILTKFMDSLDE